MSAAQVADLGWALLCAAVLMMFAVVWPMLADGIGAADVHRIEHGVGLDELDDGKPCTCGGRHCRECAGVAGTRAQNFPELVSVQLDAHRWNVPTMAMPVIEDIVPIVGVIAGDFEPLDYGQRVTPTDLDEPPERVWLTEKLRHLTPVRADVELVHIGARERVAA